MEEKIGVGIIGCGDVAWMGHLPWYWENRQAEIVAVCDIIEAKAKQAARRWGTEVWYTDYKRLLKRDDIDAVSVCTPQFAHKDVAIASAEAVKHVFCEKPMARTVEECDEMIRAARKSNVKLMIGHTKRFNPGFEKIKEIIDEGLIGKPFHLGVFWNGYLPPGTPRSKLLLEDPRTGGGAFLDMSCHYIDVWRWWLNSEVHSVVGETETVVAGRPYEDYAAVLMRFKNGTIGVMENSFDTPFPTGVEQMEQGSLFGTKGTVFFDVPMENSLELMKVKAFFLDRCKLDGWHQIKFPTVRQPGGPLSPRENSSYAFKREIDHFVRCVIEDRKPLVTGEDGKIAVQVVQAVYESARSGRKIELF